MLLLTVPLTNKQLPKTMLKQSGVVTQFRWFMPCMIYHLYVMYLGNGTNEYLLYDWAFGQRILWTYKPVYQLLWIETPLNEEIISNEKKETTYNVLVMVNINDSHAVWTSSPSGLVYPFIVWQQLLFMLRLGTNTHSTRMIEVRQQRISTINVPNNIHVHFLASISSRVNCGLSTEVSGVGMKVISLESYILDRPKSLLLKERNTKLTVRNTNAKTAIVAIIPWASCPSSHSPLRAVPLAIPMAPHTTIRLQSVQLVRLLGLYLHK